MMLKKQIQMAHFYIMQTETNKERNQIKEVQEQTSLGVCMDLSCLTDNLSTTHTHISFHYIFEQDMKQQWGNAHLLFPHNNSMMFQCLAPLAGTRLGGFSVFSVFLLCFLVGSRGFFWHQKWYCQFTCMLVFNSPIIVPLATAPA